MQFRTIRTAFDHQSHVVHASKLSPRSRGTWFCCSCRSALRLCWTHDNGGFFEHDLEDAEELRLKHCAYRVISQDKPVSAFDQAVNALMKRDDAPSTVLLRTDYFCVLCQREYYGLRCCPECGQHIYSTELRLRDTLAVPVRFAK